MVISRRFASIVGLWLALGFWGGATLVLAEDSVRISVTLKDHRFSPAEPTAPAGKPIVIEVSNLDPTPSEFESKMMRVEKVVPGGGNISMQVRPLAPGRYRFFDDYHEDTAEGFLIVK
jgi:hypothetical protein